MVRGSEYIEGPLQVGDDEAYDTITATVMIGTEQNTDTKEHPKESLHVKGDVKIEGDTDQTGEITASGTVLGGSVKDSGGNVLSQSPGSFTIIIKAIVNPLNASNEISLFLVILC